MIRTRDFTVYLAALAVFLHAMLGVVQPLVSPQSLTEICTVRGVEYVDPVSGERQPATPNGAHKHCLLCMAGAMAALPPPVVQLGIARPRLQTSSTFVVQAVLPAASPHRPPARAPPVFS